tara:strand:+ start:11319 stop:11600 length:282 start_codon:yes stop_codon:yes gene_type:complete
MRLTVDHPDAHKAVIKLNGRPVECVAADDDEGWVDVIDLAAMVDMDLDNETEIDLDVDDLGAYDDDGAPVFEEGEGMEVATKRRYGKVEITFP